MASDVVTALESVPLFAGLPGKERKKLARSMKERTFSAGSEVTTEGHGGVGFFVILEGEAAVAVAGEPVSTLGRGDHFGEMALIDKGPRSATVTASSNLRCAGISAWEFRPLVEGSGELAWGLLETLVARVRETQSRSSG